MSTADVSVVPDPTRFVALDQLRAVAVLSMISAHFAPGVLERIRALAPYADAIGVVGRLSTVAFVVCFGLTLGFIQLPRFAQGKGATVKAWLFGRARLLFVCVLVVTGPAYLDLAFNGIDDPFQTWLWRTHGVLNFYVLAMLSAVLWLLFLQRDTARRAVLLAAGFWLAYLVIREAWPDPRIWTSANFVRLHIAGGAYAYLPLAAVSVLAIMLGAWIRRQVMTGNIDLIARCCVMWGGVLVAFGFLLGKATDMTLHGIADGSLKGPPRLWYWALFSGATLIFFSLLTALHARLPWLRARTGLVSLFGQAALGIFTMHAWVLPALAAVDYFIVIEGVKRVLLALAIFVLFCGLAMGWYARKNRRRPTPVPQPSSSREADALLRAEAPPVAAGSASL